MKWKVIQAFGPARLEEKLNALEASGARIHSVVVHKMARGGTAGFTITYTTR